MIYYTTGTHNTEGIQAKAKTQTPPATEEQRQADTEAAIAFLHQHLDRFWKGTHLQKAIKEYCNLSNRRASLAVKRLRKNGHLVIIKDVEVDGEKLSGAYQFTHNQNPMNNRRYAYTFPIKKRVKVYDTPLGGRFQTLRETPPIALPEKKSCQNADLASETAHGQV